MRLKEKPFTRVTIPNHKTISKGTLKAIMKQVDLALPELLELL
jgi:predicted RNA binding protein YcfA (HicA-like mRNA interferase family)